jgi:predicted enzyme related to lactoylglutathione lyase
MAHGSFVWYDLLTTDPKAAAIFYSKVVGWGTQDSQVPGVDYTMFTMGDLPIGGLAVLPESARAMKMPPMWTGYVAVDDVDATAAKAEKLGGKIYMGPHDIPQVGRFAVIGDPQSASLSLFHPSHPGSGSPPDMMAQGHIGWNELVAMDWPKVLPFYSDLFGWQKDESMEMGPIGTYQMFALGGRRIGGMFDKPEGFPRPMWIYYFNVANIDDAARRVTDNGGQVLMEPMSIPTGGWIVQASDPQGAMFALYGRRD